MKPPSAPSPIATVEPPGGALYLGRTGGEPVFLPADDLCTHAVCVGTTGSGKTGLCVALLEEAALAGVGAIVLDPKGDLASLLLAFPGVKAEDLSPWVDGGREAAEGEAERWRDGLLASGTPPERVARLRARSELSLYTPGIEAGRPLSLLTSLAPPPAGEAASGEAQRERASAAASALLSLAGVEADPLRSREHVLLSAIVAEAWSRGEALDLPAVVRAVQSPPFTQIGVLDLASYYPAKERFELVLSLNGLLSAPRGGGLFGGEPIDVGRMLRTDDGRPRLSVVSLARLGEAERQAFVTALLAQVTGWMRAQAGSSSLRALLFLDEAAGYLPPLSSPPSKPLFLQLFKQARAFGLGVVVATQNPADIDYKALSNAGTWLVGRLSTARDRARVMEGLTSADEAAGGALGAAGAAGAIASLGPREFVLLTRGAPPRVMTSRWAMSYLCGPLPTERLARLARGAIGGEPAGGGDEATGRPAEAAGAGERPVLPPGIDELFVPRRPGGEGPVWYAPSALGVARVRYVDRKLGVDATRALVLAAPLDEGPVGVDWSRALPLGITAELLSSKPEPGARFQPLPSAGRSAERLKRARGALVDRLGRDEVVTVWVCDEIGAASDGLESEEAFRARIAGALGELSAKRAAAAAEGAAARGRALAERVRRLEQAAARRKEQVADTKADALLTIGTSVLGVLLGGKLASAQNAGRAARVLRGARKAGAAGEAIARASADLEAARAELAEHEKAVAERAAEASARLAPGSLPLRRASLSAGRGNVEILAFGLGWLPFEPAGGAWGEGAVEGLRAAWVGGVEGGARGG